MNLITSKSTPTKRTVIEVRDMRHGGALVNAPNFLDGLTASAYTALRDAVGEAHAQEQALFRCAQCGEPLYLTGKGADRDGRTAFFGHRGKGKAECPWRHGGKLRSQGAVQFGGMQEGDEHRWLKQMLVDVLSCDPDVTDIEVEKRQHHDVVQRQPDVSAVYQGQRIAFEIQLARFPLMTKIERAKADAARGVHLVWVTSPTNEHNLRSQAFSDLYLNAGGRIFAIDENCVARSREASRVEMLELALEPVVMSPYAIFNRWRKRSVGMDVIMMAECQRHAEGRRCYDRELNAQVNARAAGEVKAILSAVRGAKDLRTVEPAWRTLAALVGGQDLWRTRSDGVPSVLRLCQCIESLAAARDEAAVAAAQQAAARTTLELLRSHDGIHWLSLIEFMAEDIPRFAAAIEPTARSTMNALRAETKRAYPRHKYHRHMLAVLHPWLAYRLLAKAPSKNSFSGQTQLRMQ